MAGDKTVQLSSTISAWTPISCLFIGNMHVVPVRLVVLLLPG